MSDGSSSRAEKSIRKIRKGKREKSHYSLIIYNRAVRVVEVVTQFEPPSSIRSALPKSHRRLHHHHQCYDLLYLQPQESFLSPRLCSHRTFWIRLSSIHHHKIHLACSWWNPACEALSS